MPPVLFGGSTNFSVLLGLWNCRKLSYRIYNLCQYQKNSGGKITDDMEFSAFSFSSGGYKIGISKIFWAGAELFCPFSMQGRLKCWGFFPLFQ